MSTRKPYGNPPTIEPDLHHVTEGLWGIEVLTDEPFGAGILVFVDGKVLGGGDSYTYSGTYKCKGIEIVAHLRILPFADRSSWPLNRYLHAQTATLDASFDGKGFHGEIFQSHCRNVSLAVLLKKQSSWPGTGPVQWPKRSS